MCNNIKFLILKSMACLIYEQSSTDFFVTRTNDLIAINVNTIINILSHEIIRDSN
jgi:hypothetical protein